MPHRCQGLLHYLPDLAKLSDAAVQYRAVVLNEISPAQIIKKKQVFQAGNDFVALSQSNCNQRKYEIWSYGLAMVCRSNGFPMAVSERLGEGRGCRAVAGECLGCGLAAPKTWRKQDNRKPKPVLHQKHCGRVGREMRAATGGA